MGLFCFALFCFFPQRAALPATDSYKRNSERARVEGDRGVSGAKGSWCSPDACIMPSLALDISLAVCVFSGETSMDALLLHQGTRRNLLSVAPMRKDSKNTTSKGSKCIALKKEKRRESRVAPLIATSECRSRSGQPDPQNLASFKSPDTINNPNLQLRPQVMFLM